MENSGLCFNKTLNRDRERGEGIKKEYIHIPPLGSVVYNCDMTLIWVSHPTAYFSGFKLSKLLAASNVSVERVDA